MSYIVPASVFALVSAGIFFLAGAVHYIIETLHKEDE